MASSETPSEGSGALPVLIAAALTTVLGLAVGFSVSAFMMPSDISGAGQKASPQPAEVNGKEAGTPAHGESAAATAEHDESSDAGAEEEPIDPAQLAYTSMPPVIVNLREQSSSWVRVEGGIQYITEGEIPVDSIGPLASEITMNYFRTLTINDFESGDSLQLIKMDLAEIARSVSKGQIRGFTFTSFIIE
jgi:flagellar basal body-associated protein FliL